MVNPLAVASTGLLTQHKTLGIASEGFLYDASSVIGDVIDPVLMVARSGAQIGILSTNAGIVASSGRNVGISSVKRSIAKRGEKSMKVVSAQKKISVSDDKSTVVDIKQMTIRAAINGGSVSSRMTQEELLVLLLAAELRKSGKLH